MPAALSPKLSLWKKRFQQFRQSPLTIHQFCRSIGCSSTTFYYWKRLVERDSASVWPSGARHSVAGNSTGQRASFGPAAQKSAFVPVVVRGAAAKEVVVRLNDGTHIVVPCDATEVLELILQHARRGA
jgi:transposase-like protein